MPPVSRNIWGVVVFVIAVWLLYLTIEIARHVNAWPFS